VVSEACLYYKKLIFEECLTLATTKFWFDNMAKFVALDWCSHFS